MRPAVVPIPAAGITLDGVTSSTTERLKESVPRLLCAHPFLPEKPPAMTQQFLNPTLFSVFATVLETSLYLQVRTRNDGQKITAMAPCSPGRSNWNRDGWVN